MEGTKAFIAQVTDGLASNPRAIEEKLGDEMGHEVHPLTKHLIKHRPIKHRYHSWFW